MRGGQINRLSGNVILVLSLTAMVTVLIGYTHPPLPDEGALAHIFQLTIVAVAAMILLFLGTADWKRPGGVARRLAIPAGALTVAFASLFYLEHYWYR